MVSKPRQSDEELYGVLAEFQAADQLLLAAQKAYGAGYRDLDAFAPFPVEGLAEAIGQEKAAAPLITLICGLIGGLTGFYMQWFSSVHDYPLNVGGKPYNSLPAFVLVIFELTVLFAASGAFFSQFILNRLPTLYHPVFHVDAFTRASTDGFFILIEAADEKFDTVETKAFLSSLGAKEVYHVPA